LAIAVAGAFGALARYGVEGAVSDRAGGSFPFGTLVVNVSGALVLGFLFTVLTDRFSAPTWLRIGLTVGFLGAYTTFSTLMYETFSLFHDGVPVRALANLVGSVVLGMIAVYVGVVIGRAV
jgi:CrcB protein